MKDEIKKILKMVEEGKIKAEEAEKILLAILEPEKKISSKKFLKIKVYEPNGDKVNITLPIGLIKFATKFIPKEKMEILKEREINIDEILSSLDEETQGEIVNVEETDGTVVKIWIE
jgi:hypothetical protein